MKDCYGEKISMHTNEAAGGEARVYVTFHVGDDLVDMSLTPKKARKLAKKLNRLADELDAPVAKEPPWKRGAKVRVVKTHTWEGSRDHCTGPDVEAPVGAVGTIVAGVFNLEGIAYVNVSFPQGYFSIDIDCLEEL